MSLWCLRRGCSKLQLLNCSAEDGVLAMLLSGKEVGLCHNGTSSLLDVWWLKKKDPV